MPKLKESTNQARGRRITAALKKGLIDRGWTQAHLATLLRLSRERTNHAVNHPLAHRMEDVFKIADFVGVDLSEAVGRQ